MHRSLVLAAFLSIAAALVLALPASGVADGDVDVTGADSTFVVSGADGNTSTGSTQHGGDCHGCATVIYVQPCITGLWGVSPPPGTACLPGAVADCPAGQDFVRKWTSRDGDWTQGDLSCQDLSGAVGLAALSTAVREQVTHRVPAPAITHQPSRSALITIPVLFHSGQATGELVWHDEVLGVPVTTRVHATWHWAFGDGAELATQQAGSRWPDTSVSHAYQRPGRYRVTLGSEWSGTFQVAGLAPQPISGTVRQDAADLVTVRRAGAVLRPAIR